jgi:transcriptional regulator with XRE-family HTH domain
MPNERLFSVFSRWKTATRSQTDLAQAAGVSSGSISRACAGEIRPDPTTLGRILLAAVTLGDPAWARDLLEAYLLDKLPPGDAPDGQSWANHVSITIREFCESCVREEPAETPLDELDLALSYIAKRAHESIHARQIVLGFYRLRHRPTNYYGIPDSGT